MNTIRSTSAIRQHRGVTLVELMIAMLIGLIIITSVTQVFLSSNESNNLNRQLGLMQEAARVAIRELSSDIRMAGFTGCSPTADTGNALQNNASDAEWMTAEQKIQGLSLSDTQSRLDTAALSEGIVIFKLDPDNVFQVASHNTSSTNMTVDRSMDGVIARGQPVGASRQDCSQVSLFSPSSVSGSSLSHSGSGGGSFGNCFSQLEGNFRCYDSTRPTGPVSFNPGYIRPLDSVSYFIKLENNLPTLFRKEVSNPAGTPLVDGIESMRVYYGLDSDDDNVANQYINAGDRSWRHADWQQIASVRVHLLVRSETETIPEDLAPKAYFFDGQTVTPPDIAPGVTDRYLRKEYVMTLGLRNPG